VARVDTTNNNSDWTKTKRRRTPLVHDTGLTNGRHAKLHTTLTPDVGSSAHTTAGEWPMRRDFH
jgi:hypothetical protein